MKVVKRRGVFWFIKPERGESTKRLLLAIARASFETARPARISHLFYNRRDQWDDVRRHIQLNPRAGAGEPLLLMDYVAGRRCKTEVVKGRKYLRFFPGDYREKDAELILTLANDYLHLQEE
ncbi:MAG: hypothetical protein ACE5MH_02470 [Terriglobia bacterium]